MNLFSLPGGIVVMVSLLLVSQFSSVVAETHFHKTTSNESEITVYSTDDARMLEHLRNHDYDRANLHAHANGVSHRHGSNAPGNRRAFNPMASARRPTQPQPGSSGSVVRFVVVGDTQGNGEAGVHSPFVPQLLDDIEARNPDFVVFPGDLVGTGSVSTF